ncbi:MAG: hypothetical protein CM15mP74_07790 [Halieaceae bacterium]|nr:MAG: hypothetical protein CM15mP74_07790 [Halieaceae bacterium]
MRACCFPANDWVWVRRTSAVYRKPLHSQPLFRGGRTPPEDFAGEQAGGEPVPSHHSPLFKVEPTASVTLGVEASVTALLDLLNQ